MTEVWRLCKARYAATAFSGEGARLFSGRWNPAGTAVVYTSTSKSLATLEWLVNLDQSMAPDDMVQISLVIPRAVLIETVDVAALPDDWRRVEHAALQAMGAEWVASGRSVALRVPSAVVDGEWNVLLNPAHPDFGRLVSGVASPYRVDQRLVRGRH